MDGKATGGDRTMIVRADVKCYYCGHVSGQVQGDPTDPRTRWSFHPVPGSDVQSVSARNSIRCLRCGGPVFLDEIEAIRPRSCSAEQPVISATS